MRVGFVQFHPIFGNIGQNLSRVEAKLSRVDADLLVLPELFNTGYFFSGRKQLRQLAEEIPGGETTRFLMGLSKKRKLAIVAGIAEKDKGKIYNSSIFVNPRGDLHLYRKLHLFDREKRWFDAGNLKLKVISFRGAKIGLMICFDWIFPELARSLVLLGAEVLCHPSNLVLQHCQRAMVTRSVENGIFIITANRVGTERQKGEEITFTGKSQITSPKGEILVSAPGNKESLGVADINLKEARDKFFTPANHLIKDRRRTFYRL
jgi:predicted amidohydrolase